MFYNCCLVWIAGQGIARQRQAIVNGLRDSVTAFGDDVPNVSSHDVVRLLFCSLLWCMCALAWYCSLT